MRLPGTRHSCTRQRMGLLDARVGVRCYQNNHFQPRGEIISKLRDLTDVYMKLKRKHLSEAQIGSLRQDTHLVEELE